MGKKVKKEKFDYKRNYEWLIVAQSYLQCALMCALILREEIGKYGISDNSPLRKIYGNYTQSPEYLIFPILFNFKHGIEVYLKVISGMSNSNFTKSHDLINLSKDAKVRDKTIFLKIIKKYAYSKLLLSTNGKCDVNNEFE